MRPFAALQPWHRALAAAMEMAVPCTRTETLDLTRASGRSLAADVVAAVDVPASDRAAMDGYAVPSRDVGNADGLRLQGRVAAGEIYDGTVGPGACVEIATGAVIPEGTDAVVPVEISQRQGDRIRCPDTVREGDHIARCGSDLRRGHAIARAGDRASAALLAACAAGGAVQLEVYARPRVLIAPTGDEVAPLGQPLPAGSVYDSNAAGLLVLAGEAGAEGTHAGIVADRPGALRELLRDGDADLLVTVGGTSVGRRDLVSDAVSDAGRILVHGVAVRPGKPLLLGATDQVAILGLPGFPTTCMMLGYALMDRMLRRMSRMPPRARVEAGLADRVASPPGLTQLLPVALEGDMARPTFRFSSAVSSMARASGWIEIAPEVEQLEAGDQVCMHRF